MTEKATVSSYPFPSAALSLVVDAMFLFFGSLIPIIFIQALPPPAAGGTNQNVDIDNTMRLIDLTLNR